MPQIDIQDNQPEEGKVQPIPEEAILKRASSIAQNLRQSPELVNALAGDLATKGFDNPEGLAKAEREIIASGTKHCILSRASEGIERNRLDGICEDCQTEMKQFGGTLTQDLLKTAIGEEKEKEEEETPTTPPGGGFTLPGMKKDPAPKRILKQVKKNQR